MQWHHGRELFSYHAYGYYLSFFFLITFLFSKIKLLGALITTWQWLPPWSLSIDEACKLDFRSERISYHRIHSHSLFFFSPFLERLFSTFYKKSCFFLFSGNNFAHVKVAVTIAYLSVLFPPVLGLLKVLSYQAGNSTC